MKKIKLSLIILFLLSFTFPANAATVDLVRSTVEYVDNVEQGGILESVWNTPSLSNEEVRYLINDIPSEFDVSEANVQISSNMGTFDKIIKSYKIVLRSTTALNGNLEVKINISIPSDCPENTYTLNVSEMVGSDSDISNPSSIDITVKKSSTNPPSITVLHPNGGESIPIATQMLVRTHATDDTAVTNVTFSYSNNSGSDWNLIGAGTRVSGTDKDGIWNRTWNTSGLGAGSNYLIRAVADNGTSTSEDQSDSTFSLTSTPPSSNDNGNGNGGGGGSSSSSSSGGGGGSSGEDFYNIFLSETDRQSIFKNSDVSFIFDLEDNIVRHINFTALKSAGTVAAKVEILNNASTLVSTPPPNKVYKNLNIWVGNAGWATKRNIADVTVVFTVDKSWINENNIDKSSIALYRYSDDTWHELVTMKIAEDANSLQFEAETPGFSPFAITGKEFEREAGGEGIISEPAVTVDKTPVPTPTEKKGIPGFSLFAGLSVLLIAVQLLRKKK